MKKLILTASFLLTFTAVTWAGTSQELTINGQTVEKTVARITFDGDNAVLQFTDNTSETADMGTVVLTFDFNTATAIYELKPTVGRLLDMNGLEAGTSIEIYDAAGKKVLTATAQQASTQLSVETLKKGIYVMKAGHQFVKFVKR